MHFSLPAAAFKQMLSTAKQALAGKSTLPILAMLHFRVAEDGRTITVTSTDLDVTVEQTLPLLAPGGPGEWCLDYKALAAIRPDKDTPVRIDADPHGAQVQYVSGRFSASAMIPRDGAEQFPLPPTPPPDACVRVNLPQRSLDAIITALRFASEDETRYVLNGVLLTPSEGGSAVATDGRRLIQLRVPSTPVPCILPTKLCKILASLKPTAAQATILLDRNGHSELYGSHAVFRLGDVTVHSKLIEGNFPNYKQVIPPSAESTSAITFTDHPAVAAWLSTLREAKGSFSVRLEPRPPHSVDLIHTSGQITATAFLQDGPPTIAFNPHFLATALTAIGGTLYLSDGESPGVMRCPGSLAVLMPMRVTTQVPAEPTPSAT